MPTSSEKVINNPLTGNELKEYLRVIAGKLLDAEGLLSPHIAFGKVSGSVKLTLKLENAYFPESVTTIDFVQERPIPEGTKIEQAEDFSQRTATFEMDNPNAERVRLGLPVPVETKQLDGTKQIEHIKYPIEDVDDLPEEHVTITDTTEQGKKELGL